MTQNVAHFKAWRDCRGDVFCLNCNDLVYLDHEETLVRSTDVPGEVIEFDLYICHACQHASVFYDRRTLEVHEVIAQGNEKLLRASISEIARHANHAARQGADSPEGSIYIADSCEGEFIPTMEMRYQLTTAGRALVAALNQGGAA